MIPPSIYRAVLDGDIESVRRWLNSGERDLNEVVNFGACFAETEHGSLLHATVLCTGRPDETRLLKLLLDHGADVGAVTKNFGVTPLHWCKHPGESALLLDRGADIEAPTKDGTRPIHTAISHFPVLHFIVRRGANVFAKHVDGQDAEAFARARLADTRPCFVKCWPDYQKSANFLAAVKWAGGWKQYWRAPRIELVRHRSLCDRGRAAPCSTVTFANIEACHALTSAEIKIFARLFGPSATRSPRGSSNRLPNEIFWTILTFWRSSRDFPEDEDGLSGDDVGEHFGEDEDEDEDEDDEEEESGSEYGD